MTTLLSGLESLRRPSGAYWAALASDYRACWLRDQLYSAMSHYYRGDFEQLKAGVRVVLDILNRHRWKIEKAICLPPTMAGDFIHAKYEPDSFDEITRDWGHHQLDVLGLLLHVIADLNFKNIEIIRDKNDKELIQLLVFYLLALRYWERPDNGMWEEGLDLHSSSIGAVLAGLSYIQRRQLACIPEYLITLGRETLNRLLPNESPHRDTDMAQLSLIWPYNIVSTRVADIILSRIKTKLVQIHGLNRYWEDAYFRSANGVSAEWPMGFLWLSIIHSQRHQTVEAKFWLEKGLQQVTSNGHIPELYRDDKPNDHTPLAWAHSLAIIAQAKLGSFLPTSPENKAI